ncbi:glutamine-rich protein 2-like [Passer domesticus]|uniref:glutamine-rich protein 2-like n=1 Tax=Passer domesticus TaxID=48849 RepID=UPI0030FE979B
MATSLDTLSLSQMLDLAIGTPQKGAIQFAAMRKLLQAVLEHLDVQYLTSQEPWPGQLSGPSLADVAAEVKEFKKEMKEYKKHTSKVLSEEIGGIKAENSRIAENLKKFQETQTLVVSEHLEEIEKLKAGQRHLSGELNKVQMSRNQDMTLIQDLREEVDKIKTTQLLMEGDIKKLKESLALMKKLEEDLKKLRKDTAKWKEESSKEISQQIEALRQETRRELQKMGEQQERRNAMLEQMLNETADQLNEQDQELRQQMEAKFLQIQKDYEKLNLASGMLQKDSQQKQKDITMLFQSLEKLQKEKADQQDMLAAMDMKADKAALGSKVNCSQFEENMEELDERMEELQSQISGQEQHWNKMQQQISDAMEEKLDRLELKTFRKHLEDSWNRNMEELENRLSRENAAGYKKQLPVPFTCLSCDRMLTVQVPGQSSETLPYLQPMPPSKEPQHSQRRQLVNGRVPRVPQSSGDHQSRSSTMQNIKASPYTSAELQRFLVLHNKVGMMKVGTQNGD